MCSGRELSRDTLPKQNQPCLCSELPLHPSTNSWALLVGGSCAPGDLARRNDVLYEVSLGRLGQSTHRAATVQSSLGRLSGSGGCPPASPYIGLLLHPVLALSKRYYVATC